MANEKRPPFWIRMCLMAAALTAAPLIAVTFFLPTYGTQVAVPVGLVIGSVAVLWVVQRIVKDNWLED
jgi:hypothetical protein